MLYEVITLLKETGFEIRLKHEITDIKTLKNEYDAVLTATGAWLGRKIMSVPGADAVNVYSALEFLKAAKDGETA